MHRKQENSHLKWHNSTLHPYIFCSTLTVLAHPSSQISLGSQISRGTATKYHKRNTDTSSKEYQESKRWANFGGRCLQGQFFKKVPRTTEASRCRPSNQTHFPGRLPLASQFADRFPPLRLGVKYKMFNRHDAGKILTMKQDTGSDSLLRDHHPHLSSSWSAVPLACPSSVAAAYYVPCSVVFNHNPFFGKIIYHLIFFILVENVGNGFFF